MTSTTAEQPCSNCDGRKCMDCVCRHYHDACVDDCPQCCPTGDTGARVLTREQVRATAYSELSYIGIDGSAWIAKAIADALFDGENSDG